MKKKKYVFVLLIIVLGLIIGMVSCSVARNAGAEEKEVAAISEKEEVKAEVKAEVKKEEAKEGKKEETVKTEKVDKQEKKEEGTVVTETKKETATGTTTKKETQITTKKETTSGATETKKEETKVEETKKEEVKKEEHTHNWEAVYKEVDNGHYEQQLVKEAWVEEVVTTKKVYAEMCKNPECGHIMYTADDLKEHHIEAVKSGNYACGSYKTVLVDKEVKELVNHPAVYESVWISNVVKVLDYYRCSCGEVKY